MNKIITFLLLGFLSFGSYANEELVNQLRLSIDKIANASEPSYEKGILFFAPVLRVDAEKNQINTTVSSESNGKKVSRFVHIKFNENTKFEGIDKLKVAKQSFGLFNNLNVLVKGDFNDIKKDEIKNEFSTEIIYTPIISASQVTFMIAN